MDVQSHIEQEVQRKTAQKTKQYNDERTELLDVIRDLEKVVTIQQVQLNLLSASPYSRGVVQRLNNVPNVEAFRHDEKVVVLDQSSPFYKTGGKIVSNNPVVNDHGEVLVELLDKDSTRLPFSIGTHSPPQIKLAEANDGTYAVVNVDGKFWEIQAPLDSTIKVSDIVNVLDSKQIMGLAKTNDFYGPIVSVVSCKDGIEVIDKGEKRLLQNPIGIELEENDRIMVDPAFSIVLKKLSKDTSNRFRLTGDLNTNWSDIGGLEAAKQQCREVLELPVQQPKLFAFYKMKKADGIIFHGASGCGKTLLAKACATSLAKMHGKQALDSGFIFVKSPEILDKYIGITEGTLRELFERGRRHYREHGYQAILAFDEFDAIAPQRGSRISSDVADTLVPMILGEMDGIDSNQTKANPIVIAMTNRIGMLDPAILSRFSTPIKVDRPDADSCMEILKIHSKDAPFQKEEHRIAALAVTTQDIFGKSRLLYRVNGEYDFCFSDAVNGRMLRNIVEKAKMLALQDDIVNNTETGVTIEHFRSAVQMFYVQQQGLNHTYDLWDFADHKGIQHHDLKVERSFGAA